MPKLHVFGVWHTTGKGEDRHLEETTTTSVSGLMEKVGASVRRLGVEHLHDEREFDPRDSKLRYWKAVFLKSKRRGIELVPLEKGARAEALLWLHAFFMVTAFPQQFGRNEADNALNYLDKLAEQKPEAAEKILKSLDAVMAAFPELGPNQSKLLFYAFSSLRSRAMFEKAREEKLTHIVVGGVHAIDAELEGQKTSMEFVNPNEKEAEMHRKFLHYSLRHPDIKRLLPELKEILKEKK